MRNLSRITGEYSPVSVLGGVTALLAISYVALIATVMSYAALQVEFAQSVRTDESAVAALESTYLAQVASITTTDYQTLGYHKPLAEYFVPGTKETALNTHYSCERYFDRVSGSFWSRLSLAHY